jgi:small subunit ribosomal protein S6
MSRKYELVYVVSPDATDEQVAELHTQVESIVQRMHGQLEKTDNWGRRKLAYEIGRHKEGTYVLEVINGDGELMKEIDRRLKVTDLIIRHLAVRVDEEQAVVERTKNRRTETSRRRRVARGLPPDRQPGEGQRGEPDDDRDDRFDMGGEEMR